MKQEDVRNNRAMGRLMTLMLRDAVLMSEPFARELRKAFREIGRLVADAWLEFSPREKQLDNIDLVTLQRAIDSLDIAGFQSNVVGAAYSKQYQRIHSNVSERLGTNLGIVVNEPDVVAENVIRVGGRRLGLIDMEQQAKDQLFGAISEGRALGEGPAAIERRIRSQVSANAEVGTVDARALRIARTESMHASRVSQIATYEASGAFGTLVMFDNRTGHDDDECTARDGREVTFDEARVEAEAEHPNGTLSFAPGTIAGEEETA